MPLLWYRDPTDQLLKPFAVPGDELSFSEYVANGRDVEAGGEWRPVGPPSLPPAGDHNEAFRPGEWVCPTDGVWVLEMHATGGESVGVAAQIVGPASSRGSASASLGVAVAWVLEARFGEVYSFFVRHSSGSTLPLDVRITATRLRSFVVEGQKFDTGSEWVARVGDTMLGPLVLYDDPSQPLEAATRQYADGKVVNFWGGGSISEAPSQAAAEAALGALAGVEVVAGGGLEGGGRLDEGPRLDIGEGYGIVVAGDHIAVDTNEIATLGSVEQALTDAQVRAGFGLNGGGSVAWNPELSVDTSEIADRASLDWVYNHLSATKADVNHGHVPSQVGIRIGSYTFGSVAAGAQVESPALGKAGNDYIILQSAHPSTYIETSLVNIAAGSFQIRVRNTTASTNHTNIVVWYFLITGA